MISIVFGTYQQRDALEKVLHAYQNLIAPAGGLEVVIVDSSSTDGTDAMVKNVTLPFPIRYIRQENRGKTGARNRGIRLASGELILLTDGDMVPHPEWVLEHAKFSKRFPGSVGIGKTIPLRSEKEDPLARENWLPSLFDNLRDDHRVPFWRFHTGNVSVPKELLLRVGLFDEDFQGYGWEDIEIGYRLKKIGRANFRMIPARNFHFQFVSPEEDLHRKFLSGASGVLFLKKHPEWNVRYLVLGFHPIAMAIFRFLDRRPNVVRKLRDHFQNNGSLPIHDWKKNLLYEYEYRRGAREEATRLGISL